MIRVLVALLALLLPLAAVGQDAPSTGEVVYEKYCSHCHGREGDGQGVAAKRMRPEPRDFTAGKYKIRTTPNGFLPTDADLERAIRKGLPYSTMPAFENLTEAELDAVVEYIKSFSDDFEDPEAFADPIAIPSPPPYSEELAAEGRELYQAPETGCARCHGLDGRGDGSSAPTQTDDWGVHLRPANLTMPWTFRGGGTREDIYRTLNTGFNGTPMASFNGALTDEQMWAIATFITSHNQDREEPPYTNVIRAVGAENEIDLALGREVFANAPEAMLPTVGQIIQPGRDFYPSALAVKVRAVFDREDIAFLVEWDDMRAETSGTNGPDLAVRRWEEGHADAGEGAPAGGEEDGGFWGDEAVEEDDEGSFWGDEAVEEDDEGDFWGDAAVEEDDGAAVDEGGGFWGDAAVADDAGDDSGDDFWGEAEDDGGADDDFWGGGDDAAADAGPTGPDTEFSDAVAIQLPLTLPTGIARPYILFGDAQNPVELWFADMGKGDEATTYVARGTAAIAPGEGADPEVAASYENGRWSVIFKRSRQGRGTVSFDEEVFVPIAFSVWDGFNRERGNKRALTVWNHVYLEPLERPSPIGPMARAGLGVLGLELLLIGWVRRRARKKESGEPA
ncbi:MAG: c-type cytochrome [Acidobacteriota bacterium]